jgi:hypothetical protein
LYVIYGVAAGETETAAQAGAVGICGYASSG